MRSAGERADDVVGFVAWVAEHGDVEGFGDAEDVGNTGREVLRHGIAIGLVLWIHDVAFGGFWRVEGHGDVRGLLLLQDIQKGRRVAEDRGGIKAGAGHARCADECEVRTVYEGHAIKEKESFFVGLAHGAQCRAAESSIKAGRR